MNEVAYSLIFRLTRDGSGELPSSYFFSIPLSIFYVFENKQITQKKPKNTIIWKATRS